MNVTIQPGQAQVTESFAPNGPYGVVFEDDGDTGYLYAVSMSPSGLEILDALFIYNVPGAPSSLAIQLRWISPLLVGLYVNQFLFAGINFETKKAMTRTNFPPHSMWSPDLDHNWDPELESLLA